jgi:DNA-binding CsgD family transcriptional regulator
MSATRLIGASQRPLRVAVRGTDAAWRSTIGQLLKLAGHEMVADGANIILSDGQAEIRESELGHTIVLGRTDVSAAGHLPSQATPSQLDAAIRAVAAGLTVSARKAEPDGFGPLREPGREVLLTPRELEVLEAIRDGLSNKEIARRLDISLHTVKFHIESLFRKLNTRSRAEAVAKGWELLRRSIEL